MFIRVVCDICMKELEIVDESNERDDWWEDDGEPTHVVRIKPCEHCKKPE